MKFKNRYFTGAAAVLLALLCGCSEKEGIIPQAVGNLHYDSTPGRIVLRWETSEESNIYYVQVNYYDPALKQEVMQTASVYADSLEISGTRAKYGEYAFQVKSVSSTGDASEVQTLTATSVAAEKTWTTSTIELTAAMLATNAQEPSEGAIANLVDNNTSTFFHTAWSVDIPGPHYITIALANTIDGYWQFSYSPRGNASNKPVDFDLFGSTDGSDWFLIKNFTKEADNLPVDASTSFTSERMNAAEQPFSHLKLSVNKTNTETVYWTMSEFKMYHVTLTDPEAPDEETE